MGLNACSKHQIAWIEDNHKECPLCEAQELILDLFTQGCFIDGVRGGKGNYHHSFISSYKDAQRYLIEHGLIKAEDCQVEA